MSEENTSSNEDRSHEPTQQKIKKSRDQGDVAYSPEATTAAIYCGFFLFLLISSGSTANKVLSILGSFFQRPTDIGELLFFAADSDYLIHLTMALVRACAPLFLFLVVTAIVSILAQRALVFAPIKLKPKFSRISIISNAKQKYGPDGFAEFLKSVIKVFSILGILFFAFQDRFAELPYLVSMPAHSLMNLLQREAIFFIGFVVATAIGVAALDLPFRYFQHRKRLMMTYQEVRREHKESEGDPSLKSARRQRAEAIATNRMLQDVPTADIVIVNPTHYAVALKWDRNAGRTPVCVAKGVDAIAARIRTIAAESGIPIRRDPPTARSIFGIVEVGDEIKREHYAAVAAAIHYADGIRKKWNTRYNS